VDRLFLRKRQRRAKLQNNVDEAMTHFAKSNFLKSLREKLQDLEDQLIVQHVTDETTPELLALAEVHIAERTAELFALEPSLSDETQILGHHELRIAAKHLRYSLEIFAPLFPDKLETKTAACKQVQEQLGVLHDLDVWIESLPKFVEKERARTVEFFGYAKPFESTLPGIEQLEKFCKHERCKIFQEFVNEWPNLKSVIEPATPTAVRLTVNINHPANQHHQ
jgi:CHAD domain-containing protein